VQNAKIAAWKSTVYVISSETWSANRKRNRFSCVNINVWKCLINWYIQNFTFTTYNELCNVLSALFGSFNNLICYYWGSYKYLIKTIWQFMKFYCQIAIVLIHSRLSMPLNESATNAWNLARFLSLRTLHFSILLRVSSGPLEWMCLWGK
jgi:hypothetical protein